MDHQRIRQELLVRRNELLGRLQRLQRHVHHREEPLPADSAEQAIELENLDVLFSLDAASRQELQQLNNALLRLDSEEYDYCARCGAAIGEPRLEALPCTDLCRRCAGAH